jgi:hypothetical protein
VAFDFMPIVKFLLAKTIWVQCRIHKLNATGASGFFKQTTEIKND